MSARKRFFFKSAEQAAVTLGLDFSERGVEKPSNIIYLEHAGPGEESSGEQCPITPPRKRMHFSFLRNVKEESLSMKLTFGFRKSPGLMSGTEGFIITCKDGFISTLAYPRRILDQDIPDDGSKACGARLEHPRHKLSSYSTYVGTMYI